MMETDPNRVKPATHAGAFSSSPRTKLCAIVDNEPSQLEKGRAAFGGVPAYHDVAAMLNEVKPDIVSVAVPPEQHLPVVELCTKERVPAIICEKPLALSANDGQKIIDHCKKAGSLLFVNHQRRFDPLLTSVARQAREGRIGNLLRGTAYYVSGMYNSGTHLVDLLRLLTGREVEWVTARKENRFPAPKGDVNVDGWIMFEGGLLIAVQALDVNSFYIFEARLYGSLGALTIDKLGYRSTWVSAKPSELIQGYLELDSATPTLEGAPRSFFPSLVDNVVDCLEGRSEPMSTGEDGLRALQILDAMTKSADLEGKTIYLNSTKSKV